AYLGSGPIVARTGDGHGRSHTGPGYGTGRQPSGERVLERSPVCRCSMRGQHDFDRQPEQRPQLFGHLLAGNTMVQHLWRDLEAASEVDERVAGDDRAHTLAPE